MDITRFFLRVGLNFENDCMDIFLHQNISTNVVSNPYKNSNKYIQCGCGFQLNSWFSSYMWEVLNYNDNSVAVNKMWLS